jgi:hypothetical protein
MAEDIKQRQALDEKTDKLNQDQLSKLNSELKTTTQKLMQT